MTRAKVRLSLDRPTRNFWVDMGLVVLVEQFGEGEHAVDHVLQGLLDPLVEKKGNQGEYYDETSQQLRTYEKKYLIYHAKLFIKAVPQPLKAKVDGKEYFTRPRSSSSSVI